MTPLIQMGHIYIAQPPLYRIKKGRDERYLNDETELTNFLFEKTLESIAVRLPDSDVEYRADQLGGKLEALMEFHRIFDRLAPKLGNGAFLELLLKNLEGSRDLGSQVDFRGLLADNDRVDSLAESFRKAGFSAEVRFDPEHNLHDIEVQNGHDPVHVNFELLSSGEIIQLVELFRGVSELRVPSLVVVEKDKETVVAGPEELIEYVLSVGKKGVMIQRYKGLGEMNPQQLWETTMDPKTRTLLQVAIEDAVETDEVFNILMGDQVEPRREFIETNALNVKNLDV
jgi:DNA gyrase subunit B